MVRASAAAERAGIRSVSMVSSGFVRQARAIGQILGLPDLPLAEYPGVIMTDPAETFRRKVEQMVDQIVAGLAQPFAPAPKPPEPAPREIVFRGALDEVQEFFHQQLWTDGLPIIPPTLDRIDQFLRWTDRAPDEILGVVRPELREATVWNVAVNGVISGCRPEYLPILLAVVEAIAEPEFRLEDAGSTPGWEPLVVLSGPISQALDFNSGPGAMRVGRRANTSIGRFLRLFLRNVAGLRIPPGGTDKGTIAFTFNVALAENEDVVEELGWAPGGVDRGFARGQNGVTVRSVVSISPPIYVGGEHARDLVQTIAEVWGQGDCAYWSCTGMMFGKWHPLLVISPSIAQALARDGWTKEDVRRYLYEHVKIPAGLAEKYAWQIGLTRFNLGALVEEGLLPKTYAESADPGRLVPVFLRPEWIDIVVAGDPDRNQARGYVGNHEQGPPVSKPIVLPAAWERLLAARRDAPAGA